MGLEEIKRKIIKDANKQRDEVLAQAKAKRQEILDDYKAQGEAYYNETIEKAKSEGESVKRGIVIDARGRVRNEILAEKRTILGRTFQDAMLALKKSKEYPDMMAELVGQSLDSKKEEIIVAKDEKVLDQKWLDGVSKKTSVKLTFSKEKGAFTGGVIVKNGNRFVNITFEILFGSVKEEAEKELSAILF